MSSASSRRVAHRIKAERNKRAWTQELLAEKTRLSVRTVQRLESGEETADETLRLLAAAFEIPVEKLRAPERRSFAAPWSNSVKIITAVGLVILIGGAITTAARYPVLLYVIVVAILAALAFSVRGYCLSDGQLLVHRMGWSSRFPLVGLVEIRIDPNATKGSIRLFGSGGLFGFIGLFRNTTLGSYRGYSTDPARNVVMRFADKTIVVSPDSPEVFARAVQEEREAMSASSSSET